MSTQYNSEYGYMGPNTTAPMKYMTIGDTVHEIHRIIAHRFYSGEVEVMHLQTSQRLLAWSHTEHGLWVTAHSVDSPVWHRIVSYGLYEYEYVVTANLKGVDYTFHQLKWGQTI